LPAEGAFTNSNAPIIEWLPLTKDESIWQHYIEEYFESCQKIDESFDESIEEKEDIPDPTD
jgi:hypothetical protein